MQLPETAEQAHKIIHIDQTVLLQSRETTAVALEIELFIEEVITGIRSKSKNILDIDDCSESLWMADAGPEEGTFLKFLFLVVFNSC